MDPQEQVEKAQTVLQTLYEDEIHKLKNKGNYTLIIDFQNLVAFDPELADALLEDPDEIIRAFELAIENVSETDNFRTRFVSLPKSQFSMIRNIRSSNINRLIVLEGIVRQSSDVRPQVTAARFECPSCAHTITILQIESKFKEPSRCSCGRRGGFRLVYKDLVDAQRLVIEEVPEALEGGEQPKRLSIFLKEDLVEPKMEKRTTPGSKIRIVGIIREIPVMLKTGAKSTRFDLAMDANSIEPVDESFEDLETSEEDETAIKEIAKSPNVYQKFINSIAPSIYGHDKVKEALVLQLMGGVQKVREDGTKTRGDMHILLVGDPGSGKSQMLTFISKVAPKARYVSGKGASGAGLTAAVVRDEFLKGWALEAGAMVLANNGYCVIDELDKMTTEDTSALHEAMEQQRISISKANIQATLRTQTTVLAAANPKLGRFDPYASIASQIDLPPALINRFDLIFPIRDIPSREIDEKIASHVLQLQQRPEKLTTEISSDLLRKYISYAKIRIKPVLSDAAIDEIKDFYVELRNKGQVGDEGIKPIPISARQLEALVRLAEGSARVRLSKKITREDARRSIELLKHCLMQVGFDYETGEIDIDRITTGISTSQRSRIVTIRELIKELEITLGRNIPIEDIVAAAADKKIDEAQVEESIERLKREGEIFEPKPGQIARL